MNDNLSVNDIDIELNGNNNFSVPLPPKHIRVTLKTEDDWNNYENEYRNKYKNNYNPFIPICEQKKTYEFYTKNKDIIDHVYCTSKKLIKQNNKTIKIYFIIILIIFLIIIIGLIIWINTINNKINNKINNSNLNINSN